MAGLYGIVNIISRQQAHKHTLKSTCAMCEGEATKHAISSPEAQILQNLLLAFGSLRSAVLIKA
jgi:hypothetical protein